MQNIYLVKKNYANPLEGDTKPPEGDNSMKFVYHQLNQLLDFSQQLQKRAKIQMFLTTCQSVTSLWLSFF
jgi:hypothetical protein